MKTNVELIKETYSNFKEGNIPSILNVLSDNIQWELPKSSNVPFSGLFSGKSGVLQFFQAIAEYNDFKEFEPDTFIGSEDNVVVLGHLTALAKTTGRTSTNRWAHHWKITDGKIVNHYEYVDSAEIDKAFN